MVVIGAVGLIAAGFGGAAAYQRQHCRAPEPGQPDERPSWCFSHGHSSGGHGWGFSSGGGSGVSSHASFGGFGAHGSAHGSGT